MRTYLGLIAIVCLFAYGHSFQIRPRIVNGDLSDPQQFQYYVRFSTMTKHFNVCGGVLISDSWILTAAQCLDGTSKLMLDVGYNDKKSTLNQRVELEDQFVHPEYSRSSNTHDIALIRIYPVKEQLYPAQLPKSCNEDFNQTNVVAIGTGSRSFKDERDTDFRLRSAHLQTLSHTECYGMFPEHEYEYESVICARSVDADRQATYEGDGGGPMELQDDKTVIGITSQIRFKWLRRFRQDPVDVQLFTNIQYYFDWISEVTGMELPKCTRSHPPPASPPASVWSRITGYFTKDSADKNGSDAGAVSAA